MYGDDDESNDKPSTKIGDKNDPGGPGRTEYEPIGQATDKDIYITNPEPDTKH